GPFTDTALDFSQPHGALQLVFGPNEAGKSSALRALRSLLFGIPIRTSDNFRHPHPKLRVGARLTHSDGRKITFVRRKGQGKTLRAEDDQAVLDESVLHPFLGGVDRDFFEQMFAIDHDDLVQGGEEIVTGGGRVGQALFAAGAGLNRLQTLQRDLAGQCEALFKSTGKKPRINQTLALIRQTRQSERAARLQARTWRAHHAVLTDARQRLEALDEILTAKRQQQGWLERIETALPLMARRREIDDRLRRYAGLPELPEDFSTQRRETEYRLKTAGNDLSRLKSQAESLRRQMDRIEVRDDVLDQAPLVEALQHELGSYVKAQEDRPGLEARMRLLYQQADATLAGIDTAGLQTDPELPPAWVAEIQDLGQTHERLQTRREAAHARGRELDGEFKALEEQQKALAALPDTATLKTALQRAIDAGPLEKQLAARDQDLAAREEELERRLRRQTVWRGDLKALVTLPLPALESIDHFEARLDDLRRAQEKLQADREKRQEELTRIDIECHDLSLHGNLPTERDLAAARHLREVGWQLVRRRLEGLAVDPSEEKRFTADMAEAPALPEAFEASIRRADQVVDRLRREAEQISRRNLLETRRTQAAQDLQRVAESIESTCSARSDLQDQWRQIWAPARIEPAAPREMRAWLTAILAIREKWDALQAETARSAGIRAEVEAHKAEIRRALRHAGHASERSASLADLVAVAGRYATQQDERRMQHEALAQERLRLDQMRARWREETGRLEEELTAWRATWSRKISRVGLAGDAAPRVVAAVIESIRESRSQRGEADILRKRIQGIDRDADAFRQRVRGLAATLRPRHADEPPDRTARHLYACLTAAREAQTARRSLDKQLNTTAEDLNQARKRLDDATVLLQTLCREARCDQPEMLPEVEHQDQQRRRLREEKHTLEDRLRQLSAGATVDAFINQSAALDADRIKTDRQQLTREIESLEAERAERHQAVGTARAELRRMDGRAAAAEHAETAQRLLAALETDVEQYARLKLASTILARTIEAYRQKHQGP
ncbi:MAG: AAA family ATPase, partial [Desulfobacterales bacterium]